MTTNAPTGLDAEQRSMLERLVIRARVLLESDFAAQAEGRFGIHLDGTLEDEAALPDDPNVRVTRRDLVQIVAHLRTLGEDAAGAVARLLREAAFTHLNRLVAIRVAEAIGLLPESLANGPQSRGFKDLGEIMPMLAGDYRAYLRLCGDELAADAPILFDPRNPLLALEPSTAAFDEIVELFDPVGVETWAAPDTLGWAYQFFNTGEERREMREASAPRNSRDLAVRNQFFTPRYVVDFLVQNTIGRRLIENDPASPLLDELPLLVDPPTEPGPSLNLEEVKCLDPACGSGHFLLGCYDLLERAWELAGVSPSEAAPKIVASLWGVDIDARCTQVASAAIVLRARRHDRDLALPRPNIVTARGLPGGTAALPPNLQLTAGQQNLVDRLSEVLADAPLLGTLLKAEEVLDKEIRYGVFEGGTDTLPVSDEAFEEADRALLAHLRLVADQASSSVVERLFADEADDALRLVDVVRQRYDAVLMNPPFGEPVGETKGYLKSAYQWIPTKDYNLLAAFVGRGIELCKPSGYLGAITSRAAFFSNTFEKWRREVIFDRRLALFADLGYGVMEEALVKAAAYVIANSRPAEDSTVFLRLLRDAERATATYDVVSRRRQGLVDDRIFEVAQTELEAIPGVPLAYWIGPDLRDLFKSCAPIDPEAAQVKLGLSTKDDFRFVRAWWEVNPHAIGRTQEELTTTKRWAPYAKGGEYLPYWSDVFLLVDWEDDGKRIRNYVNDRYPYLKGNVGWIIKDPKAYFQAGLTWPSHTTSGFGPRILPSGCIFSNAGPAAFPDSGTDVYLVLAWLLSRACRALIEVFLTAADEVTSGGAKRRYEVGIVQKLPWPAAALAIAKTEMSTAASEAIHLHAQKDLEDETARRFTRPAALNFEGSFAERLEAVRRHRDDVALRILDATARVEDSLDTALDLGLPSRAFLDTQVGPHPSQYDSDAAPDVSIIEELDSLPIDALIDRAVQDRGGRRILSHKVYWADRRLEVTAHYLQIHPRLIVETRNKSESNIVGDARTNADELLSYLIGVAFGRWDVRIGCNQSAVPSLPNLLDAPAICSPGMLVSDIGMPHPVPPSGYPLDLPAQAMLVDEPGHHWDVEAQVLNAASVLFKHSNEILGEILVVLRRKTVREYLRKEFFKTHRSRYSKSRRKAPIYWPLTVPSNKWGVWVYAPSLSRETLYSVASEAGRRERLASDAIARLQREQREGRTGRAVQKVVAELDAEEKLAEELRRFRSEAERIAGLGWEPDLDDGLILCAAPLADLFPAWPDAKSARADLRKGKYEWATVAAWADQL